MKWLDLWQDLSWVRLGQRPQPASVRSPLALSLEPRMLFDGAVAATAIEVADSASAASAPASDGASQQDAQDTPAVDSGAADTRREVVFVDGNIQNYQQLLAGLPTGAEVVVLDASRNGLEQMAEYLEGRTGIDAIHLLSHGESGAFKAGNAWIDAADLASHSETLARIGDALSVDGDFLLYGCSTGEGAAGSALVTELARLTQADVAASTDNTGAQRLGGNWILEAQAGVIEAASLAATEFDALLAAPTTLDFDSVTVDGGGYSLGGSPRVFDGWTVSLVDSGGNNAPDSGGTPSYLDVTRNSIDTILANDGSDKALKVEGYFGVVKEARFTATSGEEFWLQSFHLENVNMGTAVRVIGYRDGVEVASQDFTASVGADTTVTLNHGGDQDWQNIDQFRIVQQNGSSDLFFYIDDIAVSAAVLPNVAPTATNLTQSKAATEAGGAVALDDIVVTDADAGDTITATLTLSNPAAGSLSTGTFGSATSTYNAGTGVWTVTGSVADVNAALAAVALTPSANNDQNFTIATRIRDAANAGPADGTISVTVTGVNDAPTATNLTQSKSATEGGGAVALDDIVVTDVDTGDTITATLTLSDPAAGSLSTGTFGSATSTYNAGTGVWTVTGSVADVNAALAAVALTPSANNDQNFTIATRIRDAADTGPADGTISVTVTGVNDAPSATNLTQSKAATEGGGAVALDDIVVTDVDTGDTLTATLTLSDPAAGSLSSGTFGSATSTYNAGTGMWTVTGSVADVNAALAAVALTPSANNDQNFTIATRIRDAADTGPADGTISVTITGVSDAPTATNLTQSKSATEGGGAVALDDIVVTDVDTGDTITATLTLSDPAAGSLSTGTFGSATSTYNAGTGV
ncbi:DUF4347 domain-containing protein [Pseudomonas sp. SP16.1]|uniref:DUF4347 domain-containing protein n=1 Tax=Pseudomonas sp. SP16.1 TaxID=3458854 RepID=UPI004045B12E